MSYGNKNTDFETKYQNLVYIGYIGRFSEKQNPSLTDLWMKSKRNKEPIFGKYIIKHGSSYGKQHTLILLPVKAQHTSCKA